MKPNVGSIAVVIFETDNNMAIPNLMLHIMLTSLCNVYPLTPHFYKVKMGFTGVYIIFLFLL